MANAERDHEDLNIAEVESLLEDQGALEIGTTAKNWVLATEVKYYYDYY